METSGENPDENSVDFWRTKCSKLEKVIKTLSNHCVRVVEHHEELLLKFKKTQHQYEKLQSKCKERGRQIKQAREVLIPVSNELTMMREKYEIAVRCQVEAESFAMETTNQNKKLKRQSQKIMANLGSVNIVDINLDEDDVEQVDEEERKYIEKLGQQIDDLEEERSALKKQVQEMNETLQDEKEENGRRKGQMDTMKQELQQALITIQEQSELLKKVAEKSEMAYKEYQDMEQTYRKEFVVRNEAERFAKKLCTERDQARRESSMALSKVADNKKLMDALLEIQELNSKTAQMKDDFGKQILDLQEQLKATKEVYNAEKLEAENEELNLEKDTLQDKLEKRETEMTELQTKYTYLQETYKALEMKYQKATAIPPPPPPPPLTASKVGGFLSKIVGRKGQRERAKEQLKKGGVSIDDNHSKAIEEMMNRIKSGNVGLRPTLQRRTSEDVELDEDFLQSLPDKEEPTAMNELQGLLSKMKKARSEDDLSVFEDTGVSDELGMILKKRHQLSQGAAPNSPPSLEPGRASRPVPAPRKLSTIQDGVEEP